MQQYLLTEMRPPEPSEILSQAITKYAPSLVVAAVSGGRDSIANLHVVAQHPAFGGVLMINTGIGLEETRQFVRDYCARQCYPLYEYSALSVLDRHGRLAPQDYDWLVLEQGMPGPAMHRKMYDRLKGRAFAQFVRDHKRSYNDRILIATGVRKQESTRRMRLRSPVNREGATVWCNPLFHWSNFDRERYLDRHGVSTSRASVIMGISGECLCGCFGSEYEKSLLQKYYPDMAARIDRLEAQCARRGLWARWGVPSPADWRAPAAQASFLPFCTGCAVRMQAWEDRDMDDFQTRAALALERRAREQ